VLKVRTVQHLRDELNQSLRKVREGLAWVLTNLFTDEWQHLSFVQGERGGLEVVAGNNRIVIPTGQLALNLDAMNAELRGIRDAWDARTMRIGDWTHVVTVPTVQAGAPIIRGTRIETSMIAAMAPEEGYTRATVLSLVKGYSGLTAESIVEALEFEGVQPAA
jgi:uncharacterized protein (DUF433 family)